MRISLIRHTTVVVAVAVVLPLVALAATTDTDVTLTLPSDGSSYTLKSGGSFDEMSISGDTIRFTGNTGGSVSVDIRSGGKKTLTNNRNIATVCGDSESSLVISTGPGVTTITPSGTCGASGGGGGTSGGGGSSGGGGGGGGGSAVAAPAPATVDKVGQLKQQIAAVQAQIAQKIAAAGRGAGSIALSAAAAITKNLKIGDRNDEVKTLQQMLSQDTAIYPEGLATGLFGPMTQRAVKRFQEKYGISQLGIVGPQTRAKLAEVFGQAPAAVSPPASPAAEPAPVSAVAAGIPSRHLDPGERNDEVRALQQFLSSMPEIYPEGLATGFYGPATTRAVRKFQLKYGVIQSENEAGNGRVGPKTLLKIQEVFGAGAPTPLSPSVPAPSAAAPVAPAPAPAVTSPPASQAAPAAESAQLKAIQEQIQAVQAKLIQAQIKAIQEKINAIKK